MAWQDALKRKLFGKDAYLSRNFLAQAAGLPKGCVEQMLLAATLHYPKFRRLKHGLVLGQLSAGLPKGYQGPALQFIYKVLADKVCFVGLAVDGYSEEKLADFEAAFR